ncbi:MAG: CRISPR-associated RAMP protein [Candidatus Aramenus sp.]|nr:CRISPR-associated RAMP protein [Candidatus Aramenus sp.]
MTEPKNDFPLIRKDILVRKVKIYGRVETLSQLKVGKGGGETNPLSPATIQIIRTYDGKPLMPGSTWKGVFRSTGEKIAKGKGVYTCTGLSKQTCMDYTLNDSKNRKVLEIFQDYLDSNNISEAIKLVWDYTCINCKIFGGPSIYSAVTILDSIAEKFKIGYRAMIAVNRRTGATSALAKVEYVEPGSIFPFMLIGNNLPNYALGYIIKIMRYINEGKAQVGGNKSRGFGFVKFNNLTLEVSDYSGGKLKALDEIDKEVKIELPKNAKAEDFFEKTKELEGCFDNVRIPFPKNTVYS